MKTDMNAMQVVLWQYLAFCLTATTSNAARNVEFRAYNKGICKFLPDILFHS
jgi:hypothetical protein